MGYYEGPGVEVSGAGDSRVNGWYSRTEAEALLNLSTSEVFDRVKLYEKDDGFYIDQLRVALPDTLATSRCHCWLMRVPNGDVAYGSNISSGQGGERPTNQGWSAGKDGRAPTL